MSELWHYLKKSLYCKPHSKEVFDPRRTSPHKSDQRKKQSKETDSKQGSPTSQASSAIINPVTHVIVLDTSSGENKLCCYPSPPNNEDASKGVEGSQTSTRTSNLQKTHCVDCDQCNFFSKPRVMVKRDSPSSLREKLESLDKLDKDDTSAEHSVIQLHNEDSTWQIIEKICQTSYTNSEIKATEIEIVLKVLNHQNAFTSFEECREMARNKSQKLPDKLPRCLADGNELLRFHGTTIACSLGMNDDYSNSLCTLDQCGFCQILRHGFSTKTQEFNDALGVLTTSSCAKAFELVVSSDELYGRKCVIVCRVIAGRIHNPLQEIQEMITDDSRFDSLVKKINAESDIEELFVLNPSSILPCFVAIYKCGS
ncbi:hypothetical protein TanjilG_03632 [Lupinus angustifolius]|uniref:PARP catalytic domain-containing protein n=1 Tax=Lupinus angustifolius TaxID=3871 RepID=A0A4P1RVY6_LUPAN|nr:PREDICTED: uncharacterized protein LOC109349247 [Lupinus angustifolius]OIW19142.1 hypothetical protein TanjilG_03632 [Lupinus angustifolius]